MYISVQALLKVNTYIYVTYNIPYIIRYIYVCYCSYKIYILYKIYKMFYKNFFNKFSML